MMDPSALRTVWPRQNLLKRAFVGDTASTMPTTQKTTISRAQHRKSTAPQVWRAHRRAATRLRLGLCQTFCHYRGLDDVQLSESKDIARFDRYLSSHLCRMYHTCCLVNLTISFQLLQPEYQYSRHYQVEPLFGSCFVRPFFFFLGTTVSLTRLSFRRTLARALGLSTCAQCT